MPRFLVCDIPECDPGGERKEVGEDANGEGGAAREDHGMPLQCHLDEAQERLDLVLVLCVKVGKKKP